MWIFPNFQMFNGFLDKFKIAFTSKYKFSLSVCLLFVSNKRQNGWTDQAQILYGTSRGPREGLWPIRL